MLKYIITENNLTLVIQGQPFIISNESDNYDFIVQACKNENTIELMHILKLDYNYRDICNVLQDTVIRDIINED